MTVALAVARSTGRSVTGVVVKFGAPVLACYALLRRHTSTPGQLIEVGRLLVTLVFVLFGLYYVVRGALPDPPDERDRRAAAARANSPRHLSEWNGSGRLAVEPTFQKKGVE